jgi:hypothetical protein
MWRQRVRVRIRIMVRVDVKATLWFRMMVRF